MCTALQLHTVAATFPETPSQREKDAAQGLVHALTVLYPCNECRGDFETAVAAHPLKCDTRRDFVLWACEHHNIVNEKLGALLCGPRSVLFRVTSQTGALEVVGMVAAPLALWLADARALLVMVAPLFRCSVAPLLPCGWCAPFAAMHRCREPCRLPF